MNTFNENEYIKTQYIQLGILNNNGTKILSDFDYNIYPWEVGYIPKCSVCQEMYNKYVKEKKDKKDNKITALHRVCGCLWFEWFKIKLLNINPKIQFE